MRILPPIFCVLLLVGGVSGVDMKKVTLSVMKGDNVTLKPDDAVIPTDEQILWKFEGSIIVNVKNLKDGVLSTFDVADGRFKEKLLLDKKTGSLTITNLATDNTGTYQLEIKSTTEIFKNYSVTVHDEMNTVSVKEGEPVTLRTGLIEIKGYDLTWKSEDHLMAEKDRKTNRLLIYNSADGRFKGRLQTNENTGSLTISNAKTTDSGDYYLDMSNIAFSLQRTINLTVSDSSGLDKAGQYLVSISIVLVVVVLCIGIWWVQKKKGWDNVFCKRGGARRHSSSTGPTSELAESIRIVSC